MKLVSFLLGLALSGAAIIAQQPQKPEHMEHKFDDPARYAKSFDDPARDTWQMPSRVIDALALKSGMKVADIGAGTGYFSMRLANPWRVGVRGGHRGQDDRLPETTRRIRARVECHRRSREYREPQPSGAG